MQALNKSGCPIGNNCAQGGGSSSGPITVMGYPGETAYINRPYDGTYGGVFSSSDSARQANGYGAYWTFTNLKIESGFADGPFNTQRGDLNPLGSHWRIVNNEMTAVTCQQQSLCRAGGVAGDGDGNYWVGNYVHDVYDMLDGSTDFENHGFYIGNAGSYEIAYNRLYNIAGGNGVQTNNNGASVITNVNIHHNIIDRTGKHGININDAITGIVIYNNLVMNVAASGLRFNSDNLSGAQVYNNTFYGTDLANVFSSVRSALQNDGILSAGSVTIRNNIFVPGNSSRVYEGGNFGFSAVAATMSHNLWYNGSDVVSGTNNQTGNPLFISTASGSEDLHLQSSSPAKDA